MEGHCSTGQSPQWAVMPMEEEECSDITPAAMVNGKIMQIVGWLICV